MHACIERHMQRPSPHECQPSSSRRDTMYGNLRGERGGAPARCSRHTNVPRRSACFGGRVPCHRRQACGRGSCKTPPATTGVCAVHDGAAHGLLQQLPAGARRICAAAGQGGQAAAVAAGAVASVGSPRHPIRECYDRVRHLPWRRAGAAVQAAAQQMRTRVARGAIAPS